MNRPPSKYVCLNCGQPCALVHNAQGGMYWKHTPGKSGTSTCGKTPDPVEREAYEDRTALEAAQRRLYKRR